MDYYVFYCERRDAPVILHLSDDTDHDDELSLIGRLSLPDENQDQMKIVLSDGGEYDLPSNELFYATGGFFGNRGAHSRTFFGEAERLASELLNADGKAPLYYCEVSQEFHDETVSTCPWSYPGKCPSCGRCHRPHYVGSYETGPMGYEVTVTFWDNNPYEYQPFQVPLHGPMGDLPGNVDAWFWRQSVRPEQLQEFLREIFEISSEGTLS